MFNQFAHYSVILTPDQMVFEIVGCEPLIVPWNGEAQIATLQGLVNRNIELSEPDLVRFMDSIGKSLEWFQWTAQTVSDHIPSAVRLECHPNGIFRLVYDGLHDLAQMRYTYEFDSSDPEKAKAGVKIEELTGANSKILLEEEVFIDDPAKYYHFRLPMAGYLGATVISTGIELRKLFVPVGDMLALAAMS